MMKNFDEEKWTKKIISRRRKLQKMKKKMFSKLEGYLD